MRLFTRGKRRTWWVEFRDPVTGREVRRSLRVTRRRSADRLAADVTEQLARQYYRLSQQKLLGEAITAYLAHGEVHKDSATVAEDRRTLQGAPAHNGRPLRPARFQPPPVARYVHEVRTEHIEAYLVERQALDRSPFRINRELRTLRAFFNWCAVPCRRWLMENPTRDVAQLPEPQGISARALDEHTLKSLLALIEGSRLEGPVLLAANHGLREGELVHLHRDAVDVEKGILWIRHDALSGWKVKGGRERIVHLNAVTRDWLRRHLLLAASDDCPYLFSMVPGHPWTRESLTMSMGRIMRKLGIPRGGLHMLRHTWATRQAEAGTPIPVLQAMGGWRDLRSMARYEHVGDEARRQAAMRVMIRPRNAKVIPFRQ